MRKSLALLGGLLSPDRASHGLGWWARVGHQAVRSTTQRPCKEDEGQSFNQSWRLCSPPVGMCVKLLVDSARLYFIILLYCFLTATKRREQKTNYLLWIYQTMALLPRSLCAAMLLAPPSSMLQLPSAAGGASSRPSRAARAAHTSSTPIQNSMCVMNSTGASTAPAAAP